MVEFETGLRWRILFPEIEHPAAASFLRESKMTAATRVAADEVFAVDGAMCRGRAPALRTRSPQPDPGAVADPVPAAAAAVPQDVITAHQHFIERRRILRPPGELREIAGLEDSLRRLRQCRHEAEQLPQLLAETQ